jgi:hypothetical protein
MIVHQGFHEGCSFLGYAVVITGLGTEYRRFQQTGVSNTIGPAVLINLLSVDCENFGTAERLMKFVAALNRDVPTVIRP